MGGLSFYARRYRADYMNNYWIDTEPKLFSIGLCTYPNWPDRYVSVSNLDSSYFQFIDPADNNMLYSLIADNIEGGNIRFCFTDSYNQNYIRVYQEYNINRDGFMIYTDSAGGGECFLCSGYRNRKNAVLSSYDLDSVPRTGSIDYDDNTGKYTLYGGYRYNSEGDNARAIQGLKYLISLAPGPSPTPQDPYTEGGTTDTGGGEGNFDDSSDAISIPSLPTLTASNTGFITLFNPSAYDLQNLADYMWVNPLFDLANWRKIFADPMDAILGLSLVPVNVPTSGNAAVTVGNISTGISMPLVSTQFVTVDCGSINVSEYWGAYLDYAPYTKAEIYLPYCGIQSIDIDDIMGSTVNVVYHIDILSGACCVYIKSGNSILYTFIGQCSSSIPITGDNWTNVINGVLSAAVSVGSIASSNGGTLAKELPKLAANAINTVKPNIKKSGAMGGTGGMLAYQKPYLILTRPRQALPVDQNKFIGYPSFITVELSELSGYTEVESIHLEGVNATDSELKEIENILMNGVIF